MSHDETTTKFELPKRRSSDNILHVNFADSSPKAKVKKTGAITRTRSSLFPNLKDIDFGSPWAIRLIAVVVVLILSMLVL